MNTSYKINFSILLLFSFLFLCISREIKAQNSNPRKTYTGFLAPKGKPIKEPIRIHIGENCIVDLIQDYLISGDISGNIEMNYRIIVYGDCSLPPGTFNEEWIAYGSFDGTINGKKTNTQLTYTADVKAGGDVDGVIIFGKNVKEELSVTGNFHDGKLSYMGKVN